MGGRYFDLGVEESVTVIPRTRRCRARTTPAERAKRDTGPSRCASSALCEGQGYSKPFFFRISSALFLSISIVGKVMTGSSFPPFSSLTAWRSPSAPGVA